MLTASAALALLHADLGGPWTTVLDLSADPPALQRAFRIAASLPTGGLLVMLSTDADALTRACQSLAEQPRVALQVLEVEEGALLLVHVQGTGQRAAAQTCQSPPRTADAAPVHGATEGDLDDDIVRRLLKRVDERYPASQGSNTERYLGRRGILAPDGPRWRPTLAAMLVAGLRPELFVPGCAVVLALDGRAHHLRGTLPELVRRVVRGCDGVVDANVLAHVVLNALLHRDWSGDAPVRVKLTRERLIATSPGSLAVGAPQRAVHPNPLLVHFVTALGLTGATGHGLRDVARRLERMQRQPYSFFERQGEVWFVADHAQAREHPVLAPSAAPSGGRALPEPRHPDIVAARKEAPPPPPPKNVPRLALDMRPQESDMAGSELERAPQAVIPTLLPRDPDDRAEAVLAALRARGQATTRELAKLLGCSRPVVGKVLTALVAEDKVRPTVTAGRSPFQSYELTG